MDNGINTFYNSIYKCQNKQLSDHELGYIIMLFRFEMQHINRLKESIVLTETKKQCWLQVYNKPP